MANQNKTPNNRRNKDIALDKFDVDVSHRSAKKKIPQKRKNKNPIKRFFEALIPQSEDTGGEKARKTLLLFAICVLIGTVAFLGWQLKDQADSGRTHIKIASNAGVSFGSVPANYQTPDRITNPNPIIGSSAGTAEPEFTDLTPVENSPLTADFDVLLQQNPDTRGWIKIQDTMLNSVIVQSPENDNYYIDHDFYGNESKSGEIFSSWRNKWDGTDDNIILFAHNLQSGYGFAYVTHYFPDDNTYEPLSFYKVHPTIEFQTVNGESETYKVFGGIIANTEDERGEVFNYTTKTQFDGVDDFNNYILEIMDRSWFYTDVDINYGDKLLTLSTCYWPLGREIDTRWVIFARKVRPGEDPSVDTTVATRNWDAKLFDYYYKVLESRLGYKVEWGGRTWDTSKLLSYNG